MFTKVFAEGPFILNEWIGKGFLVKGALVFLEKRDRVAVAMVKLDVLNCLDGN